MSTMFMCLRGVSCRRNMHEYVRAQMLNGCKQWCYRLLQAALITHHDSLNRRYRQNCLLQSKTVMQIMRW